MFRGEVSITELWGGVHHGVIQKANADAAGGKAVCQSCSTNFLGGPFVDIIEAVQYVIATECEPSFWSFEKEFPERASLERWLSERVSD